VFVISKERPDEDDVVSITVYDRRYKRSNTQFLANQLYKIDYRNSEEDRNILKKVSKHESIVAVDSLAIVKAGVKMYERGKGQPPQTAETLKNRPYSRKGERPENWRPLYRGKHVTRYYLKPTQEFVNYGPWLAAPRNPELFDSPKILMRRTDDHLMSSLEEEYAICVNSCHVIKIKESYKDLSYAYILGLLNSRLLQRIFELQNPQMVGKVFAEIKVVYVRRLPIHTINFDDPEEAARHDKMVALVERMLALHKKLAAAAIPADKELYQRQIEATDRQIDALVYELYGLTEGEIGVVEATDGSG